VIEQLLRAENALALGLLDQAELIYAQTLAHDPANAIALVGLSRVALERGDDRASLGFARRARALDPENAQAGRMVDRLEEVMRERGDAIPPNESVPAESVPPDSSSTTPKRRGLLRRLTGRS
jgi:tetratricopeptide (TPR) repeat protein